MARILVVEDEQMERVLQKAILEPAGHQVLFAPDGERALEMCLNSRLDLVITDLAMPGFNGLRFLRELRKAMIGMPVLAISGKSADQLDLATDYGADMVLSKPVDGPRLLSAVDDLLKHGSRNGWDDPWKPKHGR